jgi:hypothetical protein
MMMMMMIIIIIITVKVLSEKCRPLVKADLLWQEGQHARRDIVFLGGTAMK